MKTLFLGISLLVGVTLVPSHAQLLADAASNYDGETLGSVMSSPLTDTHGTGTWTYALAQVNSDVSPISYSGAQALTYENNAVGIDRQAGVNPLSQARYTRNQKPQATQDVGHANQRNDIDRVAEFLTVRSDEAAGATIL